MLSYVFDFLLAAVSTLCMDFYSFALPCVFAVNAMFWGVSFFEAQAQVFKFLEVNYIPPVIGGRYSNMA